MLTIPHTTHCNSLTPSLLDKFLALLGTPTLSDETWEGLVGQYDQRHEHWVPPPFWRSLIPPSQYVCMYVGRQAGRQAGMYVCMYLSIYACMDVCMCICIACMYEFPDGNKPELLELKVFKKF